MKILANIDNRTFIAEVTIREIDFLAGKKIGSDNGYYATERDITAGTTFNIVKAFDQIHRNEQRRGEIVTVRKTLEGVINSLDIIDRFIEEPPVEPPAEVQP